uniref:Uncharacterized protein n=1 Tax=Codium arabicum TaxID=221038 RepID=A0A386B0K5_CODAR|nr:hypothetical protein [Codium arabicum]AYC65220.1 hypothetical protein [Codium arabicum]
MLQYSISVKFLIECFFYFFLCATLVQCTFNKYFVFSNIFIINSTNLNFQNIYHFFFNSGLTLCYFQKCMLSIGFTFLGWFYISKNNFIYQQISEQNILSHQFEIKRFFKTSGNSSIDFVIYFLNTKISLWTSAFPIEFCSFKLEKRLNTYLFWRFWYFLKKKHKSKGIQWIRHKYYKKLNNKWILNMNCINLITYQF